MGGLWSKFWVRVPAALAIIAVAIYFGTWIGVAVVQGSGAPYTPNWSLAFVAVPILPILLLAEPWLWSRRTPLPLTCYLIFCPLFFPLLVGFVFADVKSFGERADIGITLLVVSYIGAILLSGAPAYGYYRFWKWRQDRRPPVIPDVF